MSAESVSVLFSQQTIIFNAATTQNLGHQEDMKESIYQTELSGFQNLSVGLKADVSEPLVKEKLKPSENPAVANGLASGGLGLVKHPGPKFARDISNV